MPHQVFHCVGDGAIWPLQGDFLRRVLFQQFGQTTQFLGVVPVHRVAQTDALLGLHGGVAQHALFAPVDKFGQTVVFDVFFRLKAQFFFYFYFHPQALTVEAVLVAQFSPAHCPVTVVEVFVGASPAVMHAHWVVGRDGAVHKRPFWLAFVFGCNFFENFILFPKLDRVALLRGKVYFWWDGFEWHNFSPFS